MAYEDTKGTRNLRLAHDAFSRLESFSANAEGVTVEKMLWKIVKGFGLKSCSLVREDFTSEAAVNGNVVDVDQLRAVLGSGGPSTWGPGEHQVHQCRKNNADVFWTVVRTKQGTDGKWRFLLPVTGNQDGLNGYNRRAMALAHLAFSPLLDLSWKTLLKCTSYEEMWGAFAAVSSVADVGATVFTPEASFLRSVCKTYLLRKGRTSSEQEDKPGDRRKARQSGTPHPVTLEFADVDLYLADPGADRTSIRTAIEEVSSLVKGIDISAIQRETEVQNREDVKQTVPFFFKSATYTTRLSATVGWRALLKGLDYWGNADFLHIVSTPMPVTHSGGSGISVAGMLKCLLDQSAALCARYLRRSGAWSSAGAEKETPLNGTRVDSEFLQIYLLSRVLNSQRVRSYYGFPNVTVGGDNDDPRARQLRRWKASEEERVDFLRALGLVSLHGLFLMDRRWQPGFEQDFVDGAPAELTRALLRVIDRFVVLEFGLDERFGVGEHLARA